MNSLGFQSGHQGQITGLRSLNLTGLRCTVSGSKYFWVELCFNNVSRLEGYLAVSLPAPQPEF